MHVCIYKYLINTEFSHKSIFQNMHINILCMQVFRTLLFAAGCKFSVLQKCITIKFFNEFDDYIVKNFGGKTQ